ncbi:hypothetical protein NQ318_006944 [Aromia moschata]|uniref:Uncharacterized protein n=1 Tax=Aromia moschata TaxID=1265417 RepID=A0AAV8Y8G5_9CUCU|nr:hypothetical protein NQ318_006944 [Aromia moschata]
MVNEHEQLTADNSNRVALKLPPWIPSDPDMWLTLVDRSFDLAKITCEETKSTKCVPGAKYEETSLERRNGRFQALAISPATSNVIWCSGKHSKLDDVAEFADAVMASIAPKASVFDTSSRADEDKYARLEAQISALTAEMSNMLSSFDRGARARQVPVRVSVRGPGRETAAKKTMTCAGIIASTPRKLAIFPFTAAPTSNGCIHKHDKTFQGNTGLTIF